MKVVVAIDSLKNSLTSVEAGRAIEAGVRKAYGGHPVQAIVKPLADGGEGTVEALVDGLNGQLRYVGVQGPLGEAVSCPYGYLPGMETAVIEMAGAAGLGLVPEEQRNPLHTTTYGVGQVMAQAIEAGIRHFMNIRAALTSDRGVGMPRPVIFSEMPRPACRFSDRKGHIVSVDDSQVCRL